MPAPRISKLRQQKSMLKNNNKTKQQTYLQSTTTIIKSLDTHKQALRQQGIRAARHTTFEREDMVPLFSLNWPSFWRSSPPQKPLGLAKRQRMVRYGSSRLYAALARLFWQQQKGRRRAALERGIMDVSRNVSSFLHFSPCPHVPLFSRWLNAYRLLLKSSGCFTRYIYWFNLQRS